jgi:hypothetical protein
VFSTRLATWAMLIFSPRSPPTAALRYARRGGADFQLSGLPKKERRRETSRSLPAPGSKGGSARSEFGQAGMVHEYTISSCVQAQRTKHRTPKHDSALLCFLCFVPKFGLSLE